MVLGLGAIGARGIAGRVTGFFGQSAARAGAGGLLGGTALGGVGAKLHSAISDSNNLLIYGAIAVGAFLFMESQNND